MTNEDVKIKVFQDGDQMCVVRKDFVDLQESPALFFPVGGTIGLTNTTGADKLIGNVLHTLQGNLPRAFAELEQQIPALLHRYMLCLTPIELVADLDGMTAMAWTAFPQKTWHEYAGRNASWYMFEAVLLGALSIVEMQ